jgi:hypothetical protein
MLPKIKKKAKAFIMDETGKISKKNIIKGALFLSASSVAFKSVKAETDGDPISGSGSCTIPDTNPGTTWTCEKSRGSH